MSIPLAYHDLGEGPPLLILHGLFGTHINWLSVAKTLAQTHRVIAPDLRNHGKSPHAPTMSYAEMVADVLLLIEQLGLERVQIMGHSMGGKVAMLFALQYPAQVEKLLVVDIAPVTYLHNHAPLVKAMLKVDLQKATSREAIDAELRKEIQEDRLRMFLMKNLSYKNHHYEWQLNLPAIERAMLEIFAFPAEAESFRYSGPTQLIGGSHSAYIQHRHYATIYRLFPEAKLLMIPRAGHWIHAEQPEAFMAGVQSFLNKS